MQIGAEPQQRGGLRARRAAAPILIACVASGLVVSALVGRRPHATAIDGPPPTIHPAPNSWIDVPDSACSVEFSPDGKLIAVGSVNLRPLYSRSNPGLSNPGYLSVFDGRTLKRLGSVQTPTGVGAIAISRDRRQALIPGGRLGPFSSYVVALPSLRITRVGDHSPIVSLSGVSFEGDIARAEWNEYAASRMAILGGTLPVSLDSSLTNPVGHTSALSTDNKLLAASDQYFVGGYGLPAGSSFIYVLDTRSGATISRIPADLQANMAFVPSRSELVGCSQDTGIVSAWSYSDAQPLWSSSPALGRFVSVAASPIGSQVLACSDAGFAVWDSGSGRLLEYASYPSGYPQTIGYGGEWPQRARYAPSGRQMLICRDGGVAIFRSPADSKPSSK